MYQEFHGRSNANPKNKANLLSLFTFYFSLDLFKKALKNDIKQEDLYELQEKFRAKKLGDFIQEKLTKINYTINRVSLQKLICQLIGKQLLLIGIIQLLISTFMMLFNPYLISNIVAYFSLSGTVTKKEVIYNTIIFIGINILNTFYYNHYMFWIAEIGMKTKIALSSIIYRKCLKLSPHSCTRFTIGNVVTLLNKDVNYVEQGFEFFIEMFVGIFHLFLLSYIIVQKIGIISFVDSGVTILILFFHVFMGRFMYNKRQETAKKTDIRIHLTQECLSAIKIVKMYTWEQFFSTKISQARRKEIFKLRQIYIAKIVSYCIGDLSSKVSFYGFVVVYAWLGNTMPAEDIYFLLSCIAFLKLTTTVYFACGIEYISEMKAAMTRIQKLLQQEEITLPSKIKCAKPSIIFEDIAIQIEQNIILKSISLYFESGLNLITGATGTGKTVIIKAILGEYKTTEGQLKIKGSVSYASAEPWVFAGTLRQNILFGEKYDKTRYEVILNICALEQDLSMLDNITIGTGGTNISKGQQARITLARAVYRDSDIYLIDDCLSCLDIHVQNEIFYGCIKHFLKDKLVVMISHNKKYIRDANKHCIINNKFITTEEKKYDTNTATENEENYTTPINNYINKEIPHLTKWVDEEDESYEGTILLKNRDNINLDTYREVNKEGVVDVSMYIKYIKLGGGFLISLLILFLFVISQTTLIINEQIITKWINIEDNLYAMQKNYSIDNDMYRKYSEERKYTLKLFTIAIVILVVLYVIRSVSVFILASKVSVNIHKIMAKNIINSLMSVLDSHLIGNILNRFSKDLSTIDETLVFVIFYLTACLCVIVGILILVASTNSIFLIPTALLCLVLFLLRRIYIPAGRSLTRLDGATRSPVVGHLNDTLGGLSTIRAFEKQKIVTEEFDKHLDLVSSAYHMGQVAVKTFSLYLELSTIIFIGIVIFVFIIFDSGILAATVGLALTQSFQLTGLLRYAIVQWAELESQMTAVERVTEYTNFKTENKNTGTIKHWPNEASIKFENVCLKYKETSEFVLKDICFCVEQAQKIGIVGRTGSGKSSIISCLLRLYDFEGNIYIGDVNTKNVSLDLLRSKITIIPQDPIIFNGTLRDNIDPKNQYSDEVIWNALKIVEFKNVVHSLDTNVSDLKNIFSSGQKQLICLARAVIRNSKIIVLDEATANMDLEKDKSIHKTLRNLFSDCAVLIVAHRLYSVLNCDKIMVIDSGKIVEYDTPHNLLQYPNSKFTMMVKESEFYS